MIVVVMIVIIVVVVVIVRNNDNTHNHRDVCDIMSVSHIQPLQLISCHTIDCFHQKVLFHQWRLINVQFIGHCYHEILFISVSVVIVKLKIILLYLTDKEEKRDDCTRCTRERWLPNQAD